MLVSSRYSNAQSQTLRNIDSYIAARWNFADFVSPEYSAVLMEFTTPPSYGSTKVTIGSIARDGKLLFAGPCPAVIHDSVKGDSEVDWPEPSEITFRWQGKGADGDEVSASISGQIGDRIDRIDVMAEVPGFVKQIVANAAGTRPYIYQVRPSVFACPWPALNLIYSTDQKFSSK